MTKSDPIGDRMKRYEAATRQLLPINTYTIIRVDGRAFHTYLRKAQKPFDPGFMNQMALVAADLCSEIQGAKFAYHQSDEISVLLMDNDTPQTEPWFGGVVQKMASVAASIATASLIQYRGVGTPHFDARVFTIPSYQEVANYFLWRQKDCMRNSVSMAAQAKFSPFQLHGKTGNEMQEILWQEHGINWARDYPPQARNGHVIRRGIQIAEIKFTHKGNGTEHTAEVQRSCWDIQPAPIFPSGSLEWLDDFIFNPVR